MNNYLAKSGIFLSVLLITGLCAGASASGMEFTLFIFGNANEDMNIDQQDIDQINLMIEGKIPETALADANQDGVIDEKDIEQVQAIIDRTATEIFVQDAYGNPVRVKTPVERIVTLDLMIAENAQVIGIKDKIVGIDKETSMRSVVLPEISKVTSVGAGNELDLEAIVALQPGLVLGIQWFDEQLMDKIKAVGLTPLAMIYHGDLQNSLGSTKMLGYLTGSSDSAIEYVDWMSDILGDIHDELSVLPESERSRGMYLYPRSGEALGSGGKDCPTIKTLEFLGVNTLTGSTVGGYFEIDPEEIIAKNPDYIVMEEFDVALGYGMADRAVAQEELDAIKERAGFHTINAVKNDKVYLLDVNLVSHSNALGGLYMAKALYPEILAHIDPYAIHQEYVDTYLGLKNFDVKRDGIFIYPDIS
jgi:iron complex transport system substrate-binding protein